MTFGSSWTTVGWCVAWSVVLICESGSGQSIRIGSQHQLFLDDGIVESKSGVERQVGVASKHSTTPVLPRARPWEAARAELYGSAVWNSNQQRYELYYSAMHQPYDSKLAVAYSTDTVNWTRPDLNEYSFQGFSPTNIVYVLPPDDPGIQGPYAGAGAWVHGPSVIYDEQEVDSSRRYKMITNAGNGYMNALFSPDGVHWTAHNANPVINITSDTGNTVLWDPDQEKYILYGRLRDSSGVREVFRSESSDFVNWSTPQTTYTPTTADRAQSLEFYGHSVTYYEGLYVGLTWMFPNTPESVNSSIHTPVTWPILTVSRDGVSWERVSDQPFIPLGAADTFDHRQIRTASSFVMNGDEMVFMYSGSPHAHVAGHQFDIGQASLPRDRFAALEAGSTAGSVTTKSMEHRAGRLFINADVEADGYIRVSLVDSLGNPVPGYSAELSQGASGDSLRDRIQWNGHAYLPASPPEGTRFTFSMKNAKLYSFWVEPLAPIATIDLVNQNFDHDNLPGNNQYNFGNGYAGWTEVNPSNGLPNQAFNVGPMNPPTSDLSAEHDSPSNMLYYQENPTQVRVDQTSQHVISAGDYQYELSTMVGNDALPGRFGGYSISLFADDGTTKTVIKTLSGVDVADDELVRRTLTFTNNVDLDLTPYIGQRLGVALSSMGQTYLNGLGNPVPGIVFYDSVELLAVAAPQYDTGDHNGDGKIDVMDYVVWRASDGSPAGYSDWAASFGGASGAGSSSATSDGGEFGTSTVPEPGNWLILGVSLLMGSAHYRNSSQRRRTYLLEH